MTNTAFVVTNAMTATTDIRQNILSLHMRHHFTIKVPTHTKYTISLIQTKTYITMKNNHIALYIDLLFCLVIMPLTIMLLPVDRWIVHNKAFLLTLIFYVYALYFVYRRTCIPKLFMQKNTYA